MRRTALVTGAGDGLGAAAARRLAAAAWDVVAVDTDEAGLAATALRSPNTHVRVCDVTDAKAVADVLAMTGPVHRVVHAAPIVSGDPALPALEQPPGEADEAMRTGFTAAVNVVRAALPGMLDQGAGELILCPPPGRAGRWTAASGAAAAAVLAYAGAVADEYAGRGVIVRRVLLPGLTLMTASEAPSKDEERSAIGRSSEGETPSGSGRSSEGARASEGGVPVRLVLDAIDRSLARAAGAVDVVPGGRPVPAALVRRIPAGPARRVLARMSGPR
ncbi:SDR family NAD(P)-dependent oxidoreductase [Actinomadura fibrosa]|uniref:SDR family NAD(P)-dependent oxidoreductase n=1 Tax=Actinomadura fibrosa TaxID=111802 RepID=A0ABW2XLQ6_9ACTN|nr:SDR family NAD(P)-dependent oxidoreductase [Actinomadura fibrosa]